MTEFAALAYPWLKAAHILAVIAWMAGLLYLPRLFVYHADAAPGSETARTLAVMERRLLRGIMNPAMLAVWALGLILAFTPGIVDWAADGWMHAKLALVVALTGFHGLCGGWRKAFERGENRSAGFYRKVNEAPTVLAIAIVVLVIVRPF